MVEILHRELDLWVDPEIAFLDLFHDEPDAFWLDAGPGATDGWSYLGSPGPQGFALVNEPSAGSGDRLLDLLAGSAPAPAGRPSTSTSTRFELGWVGWIGYETGAAGMGVPHAAARPDSAMLFIDRAIGFDHRRRRVDVMWLPSADEQADLAWVASIDRRLRGLEGRPVPPPAQPPRLPPAVARHTHDEYVGLIESCIRHISEGDAYLLCLTNRLEVATLEEPRSVYRRLRHANPTPHGALLLIGGTALLSTSPEVFLSVRADGWATTRPIKGTRPRGETPEEDALLREGLRTDEKERAENVMIVDLMRNDLGRVAELGSVCVSDLFAVEAYRTVFQLVSTVRARVAPGAGPLDLIRSAFPAGSMTGAPKAAAMTILHELEGGPRGGYAGAFGYVSLSGCTELAMTIRTVFIADGIASIGTGGGITALSDAEREYEETLLKAAPLLAALGSKAAA
jgi:aminodeoxychorismate synthase component I